MEAAHQFVEGPRRGGKTIVSDERVWRREIKRELEAEAKEARKEALREEIQRKTMTGG